ncbi:uncharacterized protein JCM6883_002945 [Sporobolomyces salmoneus]|uniref:uncharacterized protein n=1 Tax=Sporobolomyces salmoneus TaxID=183962 RepID=UPI003172ABC7
MAPPSSSRASSRSRPSSLKETTSLLRPNSSTSNFNNSNNSLTEPSSSERFQFDSDQESNVSFPTKQNVEELVKKNGKKKDYGSLTPTSQTREEQAFATLPARLSRAASLDRKRSMNLQASKPPTTWQKYQRRAQYYVPILNWLPRYDTKKLMGDTVAALTITSMIVPQAMSYSTNLVRSNPIHGLFGVSIPALVYSVFGTCRQLSVGPEAALSLIMGEVIAKMIEGEEHAHMGGGKMSEQEKGRFTMVVTSFIVFEAGAISFLLGFLRLGFLDAVLSRALMRGFITAVGLVILISQTISILGLDSLLSQTHGASSSVPEKLVFLFTHLGHTHRLTVIVSAVAAGILIGMKVVKGKLRERKGWRWIRFVPEVLLVVIGATVLSHVFEWHTQGLETLGKISPSAGKIRWPFSEPQGTGKGKTHYLDYAHRTIGTAAVIAILGFLDSIVAAKDMASKFDYPISPNRELTALGLSNLLSSFLSGTLPGFGSITRTKLAASTGAVTQFASFLTGAFTLAVSFGLLGLLKDLPKCILAVIVGVVVFSILEEAPADIKFYWRMKAVTEGFLMLFTFFLSLLVSVEVGIITSLCLSMVLCIKQSTITHIKILGRVPGTNSFSALQDGPDEEDSTADHDYSNSLDLFQPSASNIQQGSSGQGVQEELPGILVIKLRDNSLHFANTSALKERLRRLEKYGPERSHPADEPRRSEASVVVFEMKDVVGVDPGAAMVLEEVVKSYGDRDVLIYWVQPQPAVLTVLKKAGILEASGGDEHLQPSVSKALEIVEERMKDVSLRQGAGEERNRDENV